MNILQLSLLLAILLKCVTASGRGVAPDVIEALGEEGFGSIKKDWEKWRKRDDLFDHLFMKSADFIAGFINQVEDAKRPTLAALFIKKLEKVDQVLERIKSNDDDLIHLTEHRLNLARFPFKLFEVIDRIKDQKNQEKAVENGVSTLFINGKENSVIPLINTLEDKLKNQRLANVAIQKAFTEGAFRRKEDIVKKFHDYPAITPEVYAQGLNVALMNSDIVQFLLDQADKDDLEEAKKTHVYLKYASFRPGIDEAYDALLKAPLKVSRHDRFLNREGPKLAIKILKGISGTEEWLQEPGKIIASFFAETEEPKVESTERVGENQDQF